MAEMVVLLISRHKINSNKHSNRKGPQRDIDHLIIITIITIMILILSTGDMMSRTPMKSNDQRRPYLMAVDRANHPLVQSIQTD
jgi:hypothetical protein